MRLITYNSEPLYLLDDPIDWSSNFKCKARLLANIESSVTDREARRKMGSTLRLRVSARITADGDDALQLLSALRAHRNEPVAVPFWPAATSWSDRASAGFFGGLNLVFKSDRSQSEVFENTEPGWPADTDITVPLVVGYLENRQPQHISPELVKFDFVLVENSKAAWALTPASYDAPDGPLPPGYSAAPKIFPFPTNWNSPRTVMTLRIPREEIGFGREVSDFVRDAEVARTIGHTAWAETAEGWSASKLLAFFQEHGGGRSFWVAGNEKLVSVDSLDAEAITVALEGSEVLVVGQYLAVLKGGRLVAGFVNIAELVSQTATSATITLGDNVTVGDGASAYDSVSVTFPE